MEKKFSNRDTRRYLNTMRRRENSPDVENPNVGTRVIDKRDFYTGNSIESTKSTMGTQDNSDRERCGFEFEFEWLSHNFLIGKV